MTVLLNACKACQAGDGTRCSVACLWEGGEDGQRYDAGGTRKDTHLQSKTAGWVWDARRKEVGTGLCASAKRLLLCQISRQDSQCAPYGSMTTAMQRGGGGFASLVS